MIEALWSLGALGRVNAQGVPDPLWLAAIAREYRDVIRFVKPPAAVQAALFGPLAAIARRTGRDPLAPEPPRRRRAPAPSPTPARTASPRCSRGRCRPAPRAGVTAPTRLRGRDSNPDNLLQRQASCR